jgi:hypothetical protein
MLPDADVKNDGADLVEFQHGHLAPSPLSAAKRRVNRLVEVAKKIFREKLVTIKHFYHMLTLKKDEASSIQKNTITLVFRWIHQLAVSRMGACSLWTRLKKIAQVSMKDGCSLWLE